MIRYAGQAYKGVKGERNYEKDLPAQKKETQAGARLLKTDVDQSRAKRDQEKDAQGKEEAVGLAPSTRDKGIRGAYLVNT